MYLEVRLANLLLAAGKASEGEKRLNDAVKQMGALFPKHPYFADASESLGLLKQSAKAYSEAENHLRTALNIRKEVFPPDHPFVLRSTQEYAAIRKLIEQPHAQTSLPAPR